MAGFSPITAAIGAIGGVYKIYDGIRMSQKAQEQIDNFEWGELENFYNDLQVSTLGSDLQKEQNNRAVKNATQALRDTGARGVIGGIGSLVDKSQILDAKIAANLDSQQKQIDVLKARENARLQDIENERKAQELAGYGEMLNQGRQSLYSGIGDMVGVGGNLVKGLELEKSRKDLAGQQKGIQSGQSNTIDWFSGMQLDPSLMNLNL